MEAVRMDEVLPEVASGASPITVKVSFMEPIRISAAVEGILGDTIVVEAVSLISL